MSEPSRIEDFDLSPERVAEFLELGIRPYKTKEPRSGDMAASFLLIPTKKFKFKDLMEGTDWEGSYVPLIVYRSARAAILVPAGDEKRWLRLANHVSRITKLETLVTGD